MKKEETNVKGKKVIKMVPGKETKKPKQEKVDPKKEEEKRKYYEDLNNKYKKGE